MRNLSLIAALSIFGGLLGCDGPLSPSTAEGQDYDPLAEQLESLEQLLAEAVPKRGDIPALDMTIPWSGEVREYVINPTPLPDELRDFWDRSRLPRNWLNCDGYITNNAAEGYCEDAPPANWRPFMFDGQRYFVVPLGPSA